MAEKTIFPREEKADVLFNKILNDPWACEKLQGTFCNSLFCNEDNNFPLSPAEFSQALFNAYHNRDRAIYCPDIKQPYMKKITSIFMMSTVILTIRKIFILHRPTVTAMPMLLKKWIWISRFWKKIPVY